MPNTGERQAARATFERAEGLLAALVAQHSERWSWRRDPARVQQRLADYHGGVDNDCASSATRRRKPKPMQAPGRCSRPWALARAARVGELHQC